MQIETELCIFFETETTFVDFFFEDKKILHRIEWKLCFETLVTFIK